MRITNIVLTKLANAIPKMTTKIRKKRIRKKEIQIRVISVPNRHRGSK